MKSRKTGKEITDPLCNHISKLGSDPISSDHGTKHFSSLFLKLDS